MSRVPGVVVAVLAALAAVPAPAGATVRDPGPPMSLPPAAHASAAMAGRWIVGTRPGRATTVIARRHGARAMRLPGAYTIARERARGFAAALRAHGLLRYAEADVRGRRASSFDGQTDRWARVAVVSPSLAVPLPTVRIGIIDDLVDSSLPDLSGHVTYANLGTGGATVKDGHGTEVASAAAASANGTGVTGVFPGAPIVSYATDFSCSDAADATIALAQDGVRVINFSFGFTEACFALKAAIARAYAEDSLIVAAAGNDYEEGNPVIYPAAFPHVLSVASVDEAGDPSEFSSVNGAVDVAAPGEQVPVAVPFQFDTDGTVDGTTLANGTSFSSPMAAGAAAWLFAARPALHNGQVADLLRKTATDIPPKGWDGDTGYGRINLNRAMSASFPKADPDEPNDDIDEIDGTVFSKADSPVWRGNGSASIGATVDAVEDPSDTYRLKIPAHARFKVIVRPSKGDADLELYAGSARSTGTARPLQRSTRSNSATDVITQVNNSSAARVYYVYVYVPDESKFADAAYRLQFVRTKRKSS